MEPVPSQNSLTSGMVPISRTYLHTVTPGARHERGCDRLSCHPGRIGEPDIMTVGGR